MQTHPFIIYRAIYICKGGAMDFFDKVFPNIFPVAAGVFIILFFFSYRKMFGREDPLHRRSIDDPIQLGWPKKRYHMERRDLLPMFLITLVYAATAFLFLGNNTAPQTFCHFQERGRYVLIELEDETNVSRIKYYTGLYTESYYLQFSGDGETFTDVATLNQEYSKLFKWQEAELGAVDFKTKYIRIIAGGELEMGELAVYGGSGSLIPASSMIYDSGAAPLFDEQELIPERETYMNSSYFDEIYHARTAYENIRNIYPYEVSHPPLGKLIISVGIDIFGMTPFGWRFMGTLFGVFMLLVLYVFLKNMFGNTSVATCGTLIFAFDFMHFVQTRIATIDTYGVFFIMLMYFYMYRYISADRDDPFITRRKIYGPLALSGLFFGIGTACKWTALYGGAGLAVIWLLYLVFRGRDLIKTGRGRKLPGEIAATVLLSILFFIIVPCIIYYASYYPYGKALGMSGLSMYFDSDYLNTVLDNQQFMFNYHAHVTADHPYSSRWYQWIVDARPILYYLDNIDETAKSAFGAFVNPLLCWGGLLAILTMPYLTASEKDGRALFILIGYLAQLVPWIFITRTTFEYHYFPSTIFLVIALCHVFDRMRKRSAHWRRSVYGFTALSLVLFVAFYPVLTGIPVSGWYTAHFLRWISASWPF